MHIASYAILRALLRTVTLQYLTAGDREQRLTMAIQWFSVYARYMCANNSHCTIGLLLLLLLHPINGLFSRTTWVRRYQKSKTSLDLNEARDDGVLG